jgi:formylglycine-generating enzyme required for sulfatase activity
MGSTDEQCEKAEIGSCPDAEQPPHTVKLDGYWIQRTEVTNAQYKRCIEADGCRGEPDNLFWNLPRSVRLPVTHVDWDQAAAYAAWVGGRLPTEAEWEHACRSGDGRIWPWGDELPTTDRLNYSYEAGGTTEVGTYPRGANALYDMAGNVWEWTSDWYDPEYYDDSPARNPTGPGEGEFRTMRGGGFNHLRNVVRCAMRLNYGPDLRYSVVGFRVVSPGF